VIDVHVRIVDASLFHIAPYSFAALNELGRKRRLSAPSDGHF
jgi:hypothetical protein